MDPIFITIINAAFFVLIGAVALMSALAMYILVRYGRTPSITISVSIAFIALFLIAVGSAFATLQKFISYYA